MEKVFKTYLKKRKGKCDTCDTNKLSLCFKQVIDTSAFRNYQTQQPYTIFHKLNCKSKLVIYLMECPLWKVKYAGKAKAALNIRLNNHRKDLSNPKSIPADLHFRKPGHSINLHGKFTLMEQLTNIPKTNKEILKSRLKRNEDFWI